MNSHNDYGISAITFPIYLEGSCYLGNVGDLSEATQPVSSEENITPIIIFGLFLQNGAGQPLPKKLYDKWFKGT